MNSTHATIARSVAAAAHKTESVIMVRFASSALALLLVLFVLAVALGSQAAIK